MANGTPSPHGPRVEQPAAVQRTKTTILHQFAIEVEELPGGAALSKAVARSRAARAMGELR